MTQVLPGCCRALRMGVVASLRDQGGGADAVDGPGLAAGSLADLGDVGSAQGAVAGSRPARLLALVLIGPSVAEP